MGRSGNELLFNYTKFTENCNEVDALNNDVNMVSKTKFEIFVSYLWNIKFINK